MTIETELKQLRYALVAALNRVDRLTEQMTGDGTPAKPITPHRGCRLPPDFQPETKNIAWAREEFPNVRLRFETDKFIDYWHSQSGQRGIKKDWQRTWRNWIRSASERVPSGSGTSFVDRLNGAADEMDSGDLCQAPGSVRTEVDEPVEGGQGPKVRNEGVEHWPLAAKPGRH